jgi:hypothetical protein
MNHRLCSQTFSFFLTQKFLQIYNDFIIYNLNEPTDSSRNCCDGRTGMIELLHPKPRTSTDPTTAAISSKNVTEPSSNDDCCSGNKQVVEKASEDYHCGGYKGTIKDKCQEICYSGDDKKVAEDGCCSEEDLKKVAGDDCQETCFSREEEQTADDGCQDACCSGENENSDEHRSLSGCCEGRVSPCCDGKNVIFCIILFILIAYSIMCRPDRDPRV